MGRVLRVGLWVAIILGVLVAVLRVTAIRWWRVPLNDEQLAASIAPTLRAGDLLILWRLTAPDLGDLVVCPDPDHPSNVVVGRIAATGRQTIRIQGSNIYLNSSRVLTEEACDEFELRHPSRDETITQRCGIERLGGVAHQRGEGGSQESGDFEVPSGHVFLVSDNRRFPFDSREFGALDRASCAESVVFRLVSRRGYFDVEPRLTIIH